jgi:hypothetical protein
MSPRVAQLSSPQTGVRWLPVLEPSVTRGAGQAHAPTAAASRAPAGFSRLIGFSPVALAPGVATAHLHEGINVCHFPLSDRSLS